MSVPRTAVVQPRLFKVGRTGKLGRLPPPARGTATLGPDVDTSKLSHVARRRIASPPMAKIEAAVTAVGSAFQAWADRFIDAVMARTIPDLIDRADSINVMLHQARSDASVDEVINSLDDPKAAKATLESTFRAVDKASSDDLRVVGVRTGSVVPNADRLQLEWIAKNTDLIKAQKDVVSRVQKVIAEAVPQGKSVADIRKLLEEQAGYARSRAELTARDQTLKLYGQIQQERQQSAGFTHYVWTTSLDERVREDHQALDGTVQAWDDPPIADSRTGMRGHPGQLWQCRCSAVPYTGDDVVEAEAPTADLPDVPFEVSLPEPPPAPPPDLNAERERLAQERARQEAELARLEAERAAERAALEAEAERQRIAAEQARIAAEAERARVEAERMARIEAERQAAAAAERANRARAEVERLAEAKRRAIEERKQRQAASAKRVATPAGPLQGVATNVRFEANEAWAQPIADGLRKAGADRMAQAGLQTLKNFEVVADLPNGANGFYAADRIQVRSRSGADLAKNYRSPEAAADRRGAWSASYMSLDPIESAVSTAVHEFGHYVQDQARHTREALKRINATYERVVLQDRPPGATGRPSRDGYRGRAPTQYSRHNEEEFWAESFSLYHGRPEWLQVNSPDAFAMVRDVLKMLKLE